MEEVHSYDRDDEEEEEGDDDEEEAVGVERRADMRRFPRRADRLETLHMKLDAAERAALDMSCGGCMLRLSGCWRSTLHRLYMRHPLLMRWCAAVPLGCLAISLYYLDFVADVAVAYQLYDANQRFWLYCSVSFILAQYIAVWICILRYLRHRASYVGIDADGQPRDIPRDDAEEHDGLSPSGYRCALWAFLLLGFPLGTLLLDLLMFLEPLTLLHVLRGCCSAPLAEELIAVLPRYRKARVLVEVMLEGIPQV